MRFQPVSVQEAQRLLREEAQLFEQLALKVRRPSADGISPRRTARRLAPILEEQARRCQADTLWINRASRAERVGNRNDLKPRPSEPKASHPPTTGQTHPPKPGAQRPSAADAAPQTASRGNGRTA